MAGHLQLGRLIYLYDDNGITLVGPTSWSFTEDVPSRFDALGWHTRTVEGHDRAAVADAIAAAVEEDSRPSLISCKTHIGYGSPNKQDTAGAHGSPLGDDEIRVVKEAMGWNAEPFTVPEGVAEFFSAGMDRGRKARAEWQHRLDIALRDADVAKAWKSHFDPQPVTLSVPSYDPGDVCCHAQGFRCCRARGCRAPPGPHGRVGGPGQLDEHAHRLVGRFFSEQPRRAESPLRRARTRNGGSGERHHTSWGRPRVRRDFLDFQRLHARQRSAGGVDGDALDLGVDTRFDIPRRGRTHPPIGRASGGIAGDPESMGYSSRRPAEVAGAWEAAINRTAGPTALILTRQGLPVPAADDRVPVERGGFIVREGRDAALVATGSELWVAHAAAELLEPEGISLRVVSLPCMEAFFDQDDGYRDEVLGGGIPVASVEAGTTFGWASITGTRGLNIGVDRFGASAPASVLAEKFGFTPEAVGERISSWLSRY